MSELSTGQLVKVGIKEGNNVENLWFEVMFVDNGGEFIGRCDNRPIGVTSVEYNEHIRLHESEILAHHQEEGRREKYSGPCFDNCDGLCRNNY